MPKHLETGQKYLIYLKNPLATCSNFLADFCPIRMVTLVTVYWLKINNLALLVPRIVSSGDSLFKSPPTEAEKKMIHDFFIQTVTSLT